MRLLFFSLIIVACLFAAKTYIVTENSCQSQCQGCNVLAMSGRSLMEGILWFPVSMTDEYPEEDEDASSIPNFQEEFCDKDLSTLQAVLNVFITLDDCISLVVSSLLEHVFFLGGLSKYYFLDGLPNIIDTSALSQSLHDLAAEIRNQGSDVIGVSRLFTAIGYSIKFCSIKLLEFLSSISESVSWLASFTHTNDWLSFVRYGIAALLAASCLKYIYWTAKNIKLILVGKNSFYGSKEVRQDGLDNSQQESANHYPMCEFFDDLPCNCGGKNEENVRTHHYRMCAHFEGLPCNCGGTVVKEFSRKDELGKTIKKEITRGQRPEHFQTFLHEQESNTSEFFRKKRPSLSTVLQSPSKAHRPIVLQTFNMQTSNVPDKDVFNLKQPDYNESQEQNCGNVSPKKGRSKERRVSFSDVRETLADKTDNRDSNMNIKSGSKNELTRTDSFLPIDGISLPGSTDLSPRSSTTRSSSFRHIQTSSRGILTVDDRILPNDGVYLPEITDISPRVSTVKQTCSNLPPSASSSSYSTTSTSPRNVSNQFISHPSTVDNLDSTSASDGTSTINVQGTPSDSSTIPGRTSFVSITGKDFSKASNRSSSIRAPGEAFDLPTIFEKPSLTAVPNSSFDLQRVRYSSTNNLNENPMPPINSDSSDSLSASISQKCSLSTASSLPPSTANEFKPIKKSDLELQINADEFENSIDTGMDEVNDMDESLASEIGLPRHNSSFREDRSYSPDLDLSDRDPLAGGDGASSAILTRRSPFKEVGISFDESIVEDRSDTFCDLSTILDATDTNKSMSFFQESGGIFEMTLAFLLKKLVVNAVRILTRKTSLGNWNVLGTTDNKGIHSIYVLVASSRSRSRALAWLSRNNSASLFEDEQEENVEIKDVLKGQDEVKGIPKEQRANDTETDDKIVLDIYDCYMEKIGRTDR